MKMYPTNGILFRALLVVSLLLSFAWAEPQLVVSNVSSDEIRAQLRDLKKLESTTLDEASKQRLTELWFEASEIAELNDRCGEISLSEELDYECSSFFKVKLPEFERRYSQLTGEVRINALKLSISMNDKRKAIEACFESLPFGDFNLSKIYDVNGKFVPEPLDGDRTEISYKIELGENSERKKAFESLVKSWYETCRPQILRSDGSGSLAPLFENKLSSSAGFGVYALEAVSERNYGRSPVEYRLVLKKDVSATYTLNGKRIFTKSFLWGESVLTYDFRDGEIRYNREMETEYSGRMVLSDAESSRGIYGTLKWSSSGGQGGQVFEDESSDGIEGAATNSWVYFDVRTTILVGLRGTQQRLRDDFPNVWTGACDSVPDDSLAHFAWILGGAVRFQGDVGFVGLGGGFAVDWLNTQYATRVTSYGSVYETKSVNLWTYFLPMMLAEAGFFFGAVNKGELGIREVLLLDSVRPISLLSGFVGFYIVSLELGWSYKPDYFSQFYGGVSLRIPFSIFSSN